VVVYCTNLVTVALLENVLLVTRNGGSEEGMSLNSMLDTEGLIVSFELKYIDDESHYVFHC